MTTKKLIILIIVLVGLLAGVYLIYNIFLKTGTEQANNEAQNGQQKTQHIFALSKEKVMAPTLDAGGDKVKYYSKASGNIYEVNFDGSGLAKISSANLAGIIKILWSADKEKVVGEFQESDKITRYLHDYSAGKSTVLNDKISQAVWSPDGKKIATRSYDADSGNSIISVANADGSDLKAVFQTRLKDLILEWPVADKISAKTPPSGLSDGLLFVINPTDGTFSKILNGLFGLNTKWSPLGDKFIYSITTPEGKTPSLYSADQKGQNVKSLGASGLAEKCVFSQDDRAVFCAVPQKISTNAIWPDDYYKGMTTVSDQFFKINIDTGDKTMIFAPDETAKSYDASELFLSPEEDYLFFINRKDGILYGLRIE